MGKFAQIDGQREIPMGDDALRDMLAAGRQGATGIEHEVQPELPPLPVPPAKEPVPAKPAVPSGGPDLSMQAQLVIPTEAEKQKLKQMYPVLKAVPVPYVRPDGRIQCYVMRVIQRSEWRAAQEATQKIAESKPNLSPDEIFQDKILARAIVWPKVSELDMASWPAGLSDTLFSVVQQMACFLNPEAIMQLAFVI